MRVLAFFISQKKKEILLLENQQSNIVSNHIDKMADVLDIHEDDEFQVDEEGDSKYFSSATI